MAVAVINKRIHQMPAKVLLQQDCETETKTEHTSDQGYCRTQRYREILQVQS